MKFGYARVSGMGQTLTEQEAQLKNAGCSVVYKETYTGTTADRPEFQALLSVLEAGDTLVVTKLDRFARTATDAITLIRQLMKQGIAVHILNMGVVEDTTTGRLLLTILSGFAEFERDMIVERLSEGKEAARRAGTLREGRPKKYKKDQLNHAMSLLETHSFTQVERITGISKSTLTREKRKLNAKQTQV